MEEQQLHPPIQEEGGENRRHDGAFFATSDLSEEELKLARREQDWSLLQTKCDVKETDTLSMFRCELLNVPKEVLCLEQLSRLYLSRNQLTELPEGFSSLKNLQILSLAFNNLKNIPPVIFKLENLQVLIVKNNDIESPVTDTGIFQLTKLKELYLDNNKIKEFPERLCRMQNLLLLTLANNEIPCIPVAIKKMEKLKVLKLRSNSLGDVPEEFCQLRFLELACFAQNRITTFPFNKVKDMHNLRDLCLYANRLRDKKAVEDCDQLMVERGGMLRAEENQVKLPRIGGVCDGPFKIWKTDILWLHDGDSAVKSWVERMSQKLMKEHNLTSKDYGPDDRRMENDLKRSRIVAVVCTAEMSSVLCQETAVVCSTLDTYYPVCEPPEISAIPVLVYQKCVPISPFLVRRLWPNQLEVHPDGSRDEFFFPELELLSRTTRL